MGEFPTSPYLPVYPLLSLMRFSLELEEKTLCVTLKKMALSQICCRHIHYQKGRNHQNGLSRYMEGTAIPVIKLDRTKSKKKFQFQLSAGRERSSSFRDFLLFPSICKMTIRESHSLFKIRKVIVNNMLMQCSLDAHNLNKNVGTRDKCLVLELF